MPSPPITFFFLCEDCSGRFPDWYFVDFYRIDSDKLICDDCLDRSESQLAEPGVLQTSSSSSQSFWNPQSEAQTTASYSQSQLAQPGVLQTLASSSQGVWNTSLDVQGIAFHSHTSPAHHLQPNQPRFVQSVVSGRNSSSLSATDQRSEPRSIQASSSSCSQHIQQPLVQVSGPATAPLQSPGLQFPRPEAINTHIDERHCKSDSPEKASTTKQTRTSVDHLASRQ